MKIIYFDLFAKASAERGNQRIIRKKLAAIKFNSYIVKLLFKKEINIIWKKKQN